MSRISRTARRLALVALPAAVLVAAAPASAATVKLAGGTTTLKLGAGAGAALTSLGVSVAPTGAAKASEAGIAFPILGRTSAINPATAAGRIDHHGGLRFKAGSTSLILKDYRVTIGRSSSLSALADGRRVTIISLDTSNARITRGAGFSSNVGNVTARLNATGAAALNATFKVTAFKRGLVLGKVTIKANPAQLALVGGQTEVALDAATLGVLTGTPPAGLGLTPGIVAPATLDGTTAAFPITASTINAKTLAGTIKHSGGISLAAGSTTVDLTTFFINVKKASDLTALVGGSRAPIFDLDLSKAQISASGLNATVANVAVTLSATGASALNQAFGTTALANGVKIGTATVKAKVA